MDEKQFIKNTMVGLSDVAVTEDLRIIVTPSVFYSQNGELLDKKIDAPLDGETLGLVINIGEYWSENAQDISKHQEVVTYSSDVDPNKVEKGNVAVVHSVRFDLLKDDISKQIRLHYGADGDSIDARVAACAAEVQNLHQKYLLNPAIKSADKEPEKKLIFFGIFVVNVTRFYSGDSDRRLHLSLYYQIHSTDIDTYEKCVANSTSITKAKEIAEITKGTLNFS